MAERLARLGVRQRLLVPGQARVYSAFLGAAPDVTFTFLRGSAFLVQPALAPDLPFRVR